MKLAKHPRESQSDTLDPARAAAFQAVLGNAPDIVQGTPLPPFFHQLYFWTALPPERLGRDGHPAVGAGGLIPDLGLSRRMWAGGRLEFIAPLIAGHPAQRVSVVEQVTHKHGRSGPLGLVTLRHEIRQGETLCLREWQDLIYREDPDPEAPRHAPPMARDDATDMREVTFSSTLLFATRRLPSTGTGYIMTSIMRAT